eukprot:TRINITY_DN15346_c0_g1_i1.p1 TRINITY_DN15346_c0_g1~~TRINITY_DN15346_c0_g1_i1.p1  ORF type:complete len:253 (-),score=48.76 TRINITY_DN15346_c0_g1_i1:229-963(-)
MGESCAGSGSVRTVTACVIGMPVSVQMGHSYTSYVHTDHILAPIRRLRAGLTNLFTPRGDKCEHAHCRRYSGKLHKYWNVGKTALTRRESCPVGQQHLNMVVSRPQHLNMAVSRPQHSAQHKRVMAQYAGHERRGHTKQSLHSTLYFPQNHHHPHSQLSRRHSDMPVVRRHSGMPLVRRQEESWERRARSSFLSGDVADDRHEEHKKVARSLLRNKVDRRSKVNSFRHHGYKILTKGFTKQSSF